MRYLFDASTSQWSRLGRTERELIERLMLRVIMVKDEYRNVVNVEVAEPNGNTLITKAFSPYSIDSVSDWLSKVAHDYSTWEPI
ncbi:dGTPase inhibitor [Klebsiella phage vB_Kpn_K10PH82C1]|uniref:DGTPase inhibitor n=1 Tax=Klebsiella phage vB_Kpn_K10PH82C1 TaxID=3071631 RepID=A0AAD2JU12_9CAUD|nr:dGTPase inhibitor [Klebsiella phage vB_Kpn_K10PH82C1]